jgi:hypothetical protein
LPSSDGIWLYIHAASYPRRMISSLDFYCTQITANHTQWRCHWYTIFQQSCWQCSYFSLHVISLSLLLQPWYVSAFDILIAVELSFICISSIWISRSSISWIIELINCFLSHCHK